MNRHNLSKLPKLTPAESVAGETLVSAQALLGELHVDLASAGLERMIDIGERVERAYDEFPELELEYTREDLAEKLRSAADALPDDAAVPLLMFCAALAPHSTSYASALLGRMARSSPDLAIAGVMRILARRIEFTFNDIAPAIERLRRQGRMDPALAIISEVLGRLRLAPHGGSLELGNILKQLLIGDDDREDVDPLFLAGVVWSARDRLQPPPGRQPEGDRGEALLSLAERVSAKLFAPPLSPPPPVLPPRLAWASRRLAFAEFVAQWPTLSGIEADWLPMMRLGDAGERIDGVLRAKPKDKGHIAYGPYFRVPPGEYHVRARMDFGRAWGWSYKHQAVGTLEAVTDLGETCLAQQDIRSHDCRRHQHEFSFVITEAAASAGHNIVELRVSTNGIVPLSLSSITVERLSVEPDLPRSRIDS